MLTRMHRDGTRRVPPPMYDARVCQRVRRYLSSRGRRRIRACWLLATLLLMSLSPLTRADFNAGVQAYQDGDFPTAFEEFKRAADEGNPRAQLNVGVFYDKGLVVAQDRMQAAEWYRRAADAGVALAQFNLGTLYFEGLGVEQDYTTALDWYSRAAFAGNGDAQFNLSVMYQDGLGTPVNYVDAHAWLQLAARNLKDISVDEAQGLEKKMTEEELSRAGRRYEELRQMVRKEDAQ